jgi:hypothetical protein
MPEILSTVKARVLQGAIMAVTGEKPDMVLHPDHIEIILSKSQKEYFKALLDKQFEPGAPADVRITGTEDIIMPIIVKRFGVWSLVPAAIGFLFGRK